MRFSRRMRRNAFFETNADAVLDRAANLERRGRAPDEIPLVGRQRAIVARQNDAILFGWRDADGVTQADRLKHGVDLVIAVRTFAEDAQTPVDLGEGWKCDGAWHCKKRPQRATGSLRCVVREADERK